MKIRTVVFVLIVALLITAPVLAKAERVGDRISLFGGDTVFAAGEPFHIVHGWTFSPPDDRPQGGHFEFTLEVDGQFVEASFSDRTKENGLIARLWIFNFPDGMTGTHTFTGHWFSSCKYAVDTGLLPGPCENRNTQVEVNSRSITVYFE